MLGNPPHLLELAHAVLLPTGTYAGQVLLWRATNSATDPVWILAPASPENLKELPGPPPTPGCCLPPLSPCPSSNIFCSSHVTLEDGSVLIAGGNDTPTSPMGLASSWIFLPDGTWLFAGCMEKERWYATLTRFGDDRAIVVGGWEDEFTYWRSFEIYDVNAPMGPWTLGPDCTQWPTCGGFGSAPFYLYPWVHLLSSGNFYVAGELPCCTRIDPLTQAYDQRSARMLIRLEGCSFRMPFFLDGAPGNENSVVVLGGANTLSTTTYGMSALGSIEANPSPEGAMMIPDMWQTLPNSLLHPRMYANAVVLPDRTVFVLGGSERYYNTELGWTQGIPTDPMTSMPVPASQFPKPVLEPELLYFDPGTMTWAVRAMATQVSAHIYHSVAILLPSGKVLVAGGQQVNWQALSDPTMGGDPSLAINRNADAAIYSPPYMFQQRPEIVSAPTGPLGYPPVQLPFPVQYQLGSPTDPIAKVVLIRPGSVTHHFDFEQRYVELTSNPHPTLPNTLLVTPPATENIAPTGYWMLFLVSQAGIPSEAKFVQFL